MTVTIVMTDADQGKLRLHRMQKTQRRTCITAVVAQFQNVTRQSVIRIQQRCFRRRGSVPMNR